MSLDIDPTAARCENLVDLLRQRAKYHGNRIAFSYGYDADGLRTITYGELDHCAAQVAAGLRDSRGERAVLLFPAGPEFLSTFLGCLYAGVIAVPLKPPRPNRPADYLASILCSAQPRYVIALDESVHHSVMPLLHDAAVRDCRPLNFRELLDAPSHRQLSHNHSSSDIAMLQYTSGSTSVPRGVVLRHDTLITNLHAIRLAFELTEHSPSVTWLPHYHDMGLIGTLLAPLLAGGPVHVLSPMDFLRDPKCWLQHISRMRAEISGAPNFAYQLCCSTIDLTEVAHLDLGTWQVAFNGAEPIHAQTLQQFSRQFAEIGFRAEAFYPCYGLAEATLLVTGSKRGDGARTQTFLASEIDDGQVLSPYDRKPAPPTDVPNAARCRSIVSCGEAVSESHVAIIDPQSGILLGQGSVGEIAVASRSITTHYWRDDSLATIELRFGGEPPRRFLRTGDLGFLWEGELYVTGRIKDIIIVQGVNHYPHDIERTIATCDPRLAEGRSAVFQVERGDLIEVVAVHESRRIRNHRDVDDALIQSITTAVSLHHDLSIDVVVFLRPGQMPMTTSGKLQRGRCRQFYIDQSWRVVRTWHRQDRETTAARLHPAVPRKRGSSAESQALIEIGEESIETWLLQRIAQESSTAAFPANPNAPFASFGLDSVRIVAIARDLEQQLNRPLSPTLLYEYPTPRKLAARLATPDTVAAVEPERSRAPTLLSSGRSAKPPLAAELSEPIAIIGMACRFPQADSLQSYWQLLCEGRHAIGPWPADHRRSSATAKPECYRGGYLSAIDTFAASFFAIPRREANMMDPQQRLLLEVTWEALLDAGLSPDQLVESQTGVFVGISQSDYAMLAQQANLADFFLSTGNATSIAANRISYQFGFRGPSLAMDTACSSSLVAIHHACKSLRLGESSLAVVGGANLILSPLVTSLLAQGKMLSPDGQCRVFDKDANGYVRGEGVGVVVLKRLTHALRDGDPVYCVIKGTAIGHDGQANGLTAPNPAAQRAVIQAALADGSLDVSQVDYVEAHGTGTPLGDPIEARVIGDTLSGQLHRSVPLRIGSVKANIGHLEAAAGIAGLIKVALMLEHHQIVPSLNWRVPNPLIPFDELSLQVATAHEAWPSKSHGLPVAGISSFGFGGTNAHAVLEAIDASSARGNRPRRSAPAWDRECYWFDESLTSSRPRLGNAPPTPAPDRDLQSIALDALAEILVTPRELIDPDTPLPELGVDSIMAMELLDELRELTSADIPLASLVDAPSLNQLLERIASNHSAFSRPAATPSNTRPLSPSTPARWAVNPIQRELWTLGVVADAPAIWNLAVRLDCVGTLDLRLLQQALQQVVQRHEALRSTIEMDDHQLLQIVHQHAPVAVRHIDLALFDSSKQDEIIDRELLDLAQTPIDTQRAPLLRAVHIQTTTQHAVVGIAVSHLVCDGWSMRLLHRELWQAYEALSRRDRTIWSTPAPTFLRSGHPPQLSTIEPSQDDARNSPANTIAANNPIVPMTLPYDLTASTMPRYRGERVPFALDAELSSRVLDFSRIHGVTPFVTLLTGLATVVARYNAGAPVVLHVAVAGRETVDQLHTVGPLFQIIPVHLALDLSSNLVALAHQLRDRLRAAQHESTFNVAAVGSTQRSLARQQQRIRILVDYQDQGEIGQEIAGLKVASVELDNGTAMAELAVCLRRHLDQFVGHLQFDTSLYTRQTIESFLAHFTTLLRHMLSDLSIPATRADLLSHDERHMLLNDLNATAVRYDSHALVDQVIAESANKMPENVALVCEHALGTTTRLTYASLVQQAKIIAHVLRSKHQVGRGDRVAVLLPRDITLVPALLGVLRTGAAYVPVDTSYPLARQQAIMQNADARCAITCGEFTTCIPSTIPQVDLDQYHDELRCGREPMLLQSFATSHVSQPDELRSADDPAYILYTSGSTGTPKGVVVSHRNVHNFFVAMDQLQPDSAPGVWLATTSIGFDISVFELLWTVARGYQVVLHPSGMLASAAREQGHMRDRSIASTIVRNRITHLQCTPALAKILIDDPEAATALRNLKRLFVGGDVLPLPLANRLCELVGGKVYNMYGPTETTVWSTAQQLTPGADRVSIGRPLANTQLLVLDHNLSPVPTNIPGELYIAGDGVSSGYFNDPSRTAERFLSPQDCLTHGSATEPPLSSSHRLFRTGDRVKYTSTGELLFLGRIDTQTKIQGHRIELPEIELALAAHPDVQQAVVVAVTNDHHELELRSYLIPQTGAMLDPAELRRFLQLRLPLGVVPSQFIIVSQFPLTPNGKVDRLALSQLNSPPETSRSLSTNSRLSHETQSQPGVGAAPKIRSLIADELHLAEIPETTDIQQLGLTSLEVLRIANRIETTFGSRPPMIRFFEGGSIEHLVMEHLSTLSSNSPLASDPPSVQPVADAPMVGTAVMDHPPSDSVLDRLARRRRSTPNDESQNAKSSQRQLRTGETFARFVEPVKAELLSRVGLDIAYVRGEGCYVWDEHGRRYLDFIAQYGALPFGYNPPRIWAALQDVEQNQRPSIATNSLLPTAGDLAAALLAVSPPTLSHVTFCNSGAEAAEVAIKLARAATNRPGILSTQRSFHGLTLGALAATGEPDFRRPFHVDGDHFTQVPYGDLDAIGRVLSRHPNHFAAMMIEPLQGEGGIIEPPEGYLSQLHELCKRYGVLLICDEVQTGLGRTGSLFACEQQNVAPDILMLAKALGGGLMPIGAVLSNDRAYSDRFGLRHSSTFAGNALACSAGLASLRHLLENDRALVRHVHETGSVLQTQLRELASRYPELIADTRGRGFMQAVDFSFHTLRGREGLIAVLAEQDLLIHLVISHLLHVHGIRVAPTFTGRSVMRIEPPLIATADQCSAFVQALDATLACVAAGDTASLLAPVAGYRGDELRSLVKSSCASRLTQPSANTPPAHQPNSVKEPAASAGSTRFGFIIHMASLDDLVRFDKSLAIFSDKDLSRIKSQLLNDAEPLVIGETSVTSQTGAGLVGCFVLVPFTPAELTGMKRAEALELIQQAVDLAAAENVEVIGLGGFSSILSGGGIALERSKLPPITSGNAFTAASILRAVNARAQLRQLCLHDATAAVVGATGQIGRVVSLLLAEQYGRLVLVGSERDSAQRRLRAVAEAVVLHALAPQDSVIQGNTTPGDCRDSFAAYVRRIATSARSASLDDFGHIVDLMIEDGRLTLANSAHMDLTSVDVLVTSTSATAPFIDATPLKSGVIICDASRPMNVIRDTLDTRPDIEWIEGGVIQVPGQPDLPMYAGPTHNRVFACVAETMLLALEPELRTLDVPEHIDPCTVNHLDAAARRHGLEVIT